MASKFSVILVSAILLSTTQGAPLISADVQTCIDLCTSCDGVATFVDNRCECNIEENNNDGRECLIRMRREAEEHGLDLGSCNFNSDQRTTRCSVGAKNQLTKHQIEKVAKYFLQNGPGTVGSIFRAPPYDRTLEAAGAPKSSNCDCPSQAQQTVASPRSDCADSAQQDALSPQQYVGNPASQPIMMSPIPQQYVASPMSPQVMMSPVPQQFMLSPISDQFISSAMPQEVIMSPTARQFFANLVPGSTSRQFTANPMPGSRQFTANPLPSSAARQFTANPIPGSRQFTANPIPSSLDQQFFDMSSKNAPCSPAQQFVGNPALNQNSPDSQAWPGEASPNQSNPGYPDQQTVSSPMSKQNAKSPDQQNKNSTPQQETPNGRGQQDSSSPTAHQNSPNHPGHQSQSNLSPKQATPSSPHHHKLANPLHKLTKPNSQKSYSSPKNEYSSGHKPIITQPKETMPATKGPSNDKVGEPRIITQPKETMPASKEPSNDDDEEPKETNPASTEPDNEDRAPNKFNPKKTDDEWKPLAGEPGRATGTPKAPLNVLGAPTNIPPALLRVLSQQFAQPMLGIPQAIQTLGNTPGIVDLVSAPGNLIKSLVQRLNQVPFGRTSNTKQALPIYAKPLDQTDNSKEKKGSADDDCVSEDDQQNLGYNIPLGLMNSQPIVGLMNPNVGAGNPMSYIQPMSEMPMFHNAMLGTMLHSYPSTTFIVGSPFRMPFKHDCKNASPSVGAINPAMMVEDQTSKAAKKKFAQAKKTTGQSEPSTIEEPVLKPQKKICKKTNKEEVSKKMTRDVKTFSELSAKETEKQYEQMKVNLENQKQTTTALPKIYQTTTTTEKPTTTTQESKTTTQEPTTTTQKPTSTTQESTTVEPVELGMNISNSIMKQNRIDVSVGKIIVARKPK